MSDLTQNSDGITINHITSWRSNADRRALILIFASLLLWFALARLSVFIFPDDATNFASAAPTYIGYAARNGGAFLGLLGALGLLRLALQSGETSLFNHIKTVLTRDPKRIRTTVFMLLAGLVTFSIFMFSFSTIKTRIPLMNAYQWDAAFANLDRVLFLGHDPWTLFAWIYEAPWLLRVMDYIYDVWAAILVGTWALCFAALKVPARTRFQFPLALMLTWFIGGNVLAMIFSSAGPCYFGDVTGLTDPYAAQMLKLNALNAAAPLQAVQYQDMLWSIYQSPSVGLGGISAMPSMHCATSILLVTFAWNKKPLRYAALAFSIFIFISSFMLAWHYAVDGLLALPVALLAWLAAGKICAHLLAGPND